jgi:hypothetical protein
MEKIILEGITLRDFYKQFTDIINEQLSQFEQKRKITDPNIVYTGTWYPLLLNYDTPSFWNMVTPRYNQAA